MSSHNFFTLFRLPLRIRAGCDNDLPIPHPTNLHPKWTNSYSSSLFLLYYLNPDLPPCSSPHLSLSSFFLPRTGCLPLSSKSINPVNPVSHYRHLTPFFLDRKVSSYLIIQENTTLAQTQGNRKRRQQVTWGYNIVMDGWGLAVQPPFYIPSTQIHTCIGAKTLVFSL